MSSLPLLTNLFLPFGKLTLKSNHVPHQLFFTSSHDLLFHCSKLPRTLGSIIFLELSHHHHIFSCFNDHLLCTSELQNLLLFHFNLFSLAIEIVTSVSLSSSSDDESDPISSNSCCSAVCSKLGTKAMSISTTSLQSSVFSMSCLS